MKILKQTFVIFLFLTTSCQSLKKEDKLSNINDLVEEVDNRMIKNQRYIEEAVMKNQISEPSFIVNTFDIRPHNSRNEVQKEVTSRLLPDLTHFKNNGYAVIGEVNFMSVDFQQAKIIITKIAEKYHAEKILIYGFVDSRFEKYDCDVIFLFKKKKI